MVFHRRKLLKYCYRSLIFMGFMVTCCRLTVHLFMIKTKSGPDYVYDAELHTYVPEDMRPFIRRSSASFSVAALRNITRWIPDSRLTKDRGRSDNTNAIHLITQWYTENDRRRRLELISVLHLNVLNPAISKIHLIQNFMNRTIFEDLRDDPSFPLDLFKSKLVLTYAKTAHTNQRLTISQVFHYANHAIPNGYVMLSNLDIIFDHSLLLLKYRTLVPRQTIFYLSRYEIDSSIFTLGSQCSEENYVGSHDALIFQSPIPESILRELSFEIGTWNIEVKIISSFIDNHYQVKNPCKSIRIWHYHSSQVRHRAMPSKKYIPDHLLYRYMRPPEYL